MPVALSRTAICPPQDSTKWRSWSARRLRVGNLSEGLVRHVASDVPVIASIRRNHGIFPFAWVKNHANGHDYLLAGEDHQGQTSVELDSGRRVDNLPQDAHEGVGFCLGQHHVAPQGDVLIVEGCYWVCPFELVAFDFSKPPMQLPYRELHRWPGDLAVVEGFDGDDTFTWTFEQDVRLSDGKPHAALTEPEDAELPHQTERYLPGWRAGESCESGRTRGGVTRLPAGRWRRRH